MVPCMTKQEILKKLLTRKRGVTSYEIALEMGTVCPHRRITELKEEGWTILTSEIPGKNHLRYHGVAPNTFGG